MHPTPTADEIAVILPGDGMEYAPRDIVVQLRGGSFKKYLTPIQYMLLFTMSCPFPGKSWDGILIFHIMVMRL